ncbi:MAG: response regulator transcription factor [Ruminococcaceae bacterium]|nr:response regulator transcription factor [Oscillospiraceae bacterium]
MSTPRILVIEDDRAVRDMIGAALETQGYEPLYAVTGFEGIAAAMAERPDIVLLDLGLPDMDGNVIITKIRAWSNLPIIVISARSDDQDKVHALDFGADDYLTKPFSVEELLARVRTTLRRLQFSARGGDSEEAHIFQNGDLRIDYETGCVYLAGQELHVTPVEYRLLCLFAKNVGKVLPYTMITSEIWGTSWENDVASLRVFMVALRRKLEKNPDGPRYIQTHVGMGYRMLRIETSEE